MVRVCSCHGMPQSTWSPGWATVGDLREGVVLVVGEAGVQGEDHVRLQGGDGLGVDALLAAQHLGLGPAQQILRPGPHAVRVVAEPVGDAHRHDAESEDRVLVGQAHRDDPLGQLLDGRRAVLVLDLDGEGGAVARGRGGVGRFVVGALVPVPGAARPGQHGERRQPGDEAQRPPTARPAARLRRHRGRGVRGCGGPGGRADGRSGGGCHARDPHAYGLMLGVPNLSPPLRRCQPSSDCIRVPPPRRREEQEREKPVNGDRYLGRPGRGPGSRSRPRPTTTDR